MIKRLRCVAGEIFVKKGMIIYADPLRISPPTSSLRPRLSPPATPSRELCKKPQISVQGFAENAYLMIYANRIISPGAVKTITGINQWPNSAKLRVQHVISEGRAVFRPPSGARSRERSALTISLVYSIRSLIITV
jgi:hypothetical protein